MTNDLVHFDDSVTPDWFFDRSAGGILISGDSNSGKSELLRQIIHTGIQSDCAVFVFDPPGDLAKDCIRDASDMGRSVRERTYEIAPGNEDFPIVPLNPLLVRRDSSMSDYTFNARVECRVSHTAQLLLSAWGEEDFDSAPLKFKYTTMILRSLAKMGLPMADALPFFDIGSELYEMLSDAVPDLMAQMEMRRLAEMKVFDQEQMIGSTKNRFQGFFASPIIQAHFGAAENVIDVRRLIEERAVVFLDFEPRGLLRPEDVTILANLWLAEIFHCNFYTPREERRPVFIVCDELHEFKPSHVLITNVLRQIRKMKARFVGAFHGTQMFPDRTEDRLLNGMVSHCGTHFIMRHKNPVDARFFGDVVAYPVLDPLKVKFEHWDKEQYEKGRKLVTLLDQSFGEAYTETKSEGESHGTKSDSSWTDSTSDSFSGSDTDTVQQDMRLISTAYSNARTNARSHADSHSHGGTTGTRHDHSISRSEALQTTESVTKKQQLLPVLEWRKVLRMMEFFSLDDLKELAASTITKKQPGECIMYASGGVPAHVTFDMARDPYEGTPQFQQKALTLLRDLVFARPCYQQPAALLDYRKRILSLLTAELRKVTQQVPTATSQRSIATSIDVIDEQSDFGI